MAEAEAGARGGAAACGDKKRREFSGYKANRGSAGRIDLNPREREERLRREQQVVCIEFCRACEAFFASRAMARTPYGEKGARLNFGGDEQEMDFFPEH